MLHIRDIFNTPDTLHHGYGIVGSTSSAVQELRTYIEEVLKFETKGNPDFYCEHFESFGIDDSRRLKEVHSVKSFREDGRKISIISVHGFTREAQNAVLKIFEEPGEGSVFFLVVPANVTLLPTLRSRLVMIAHTGDEALATRASTFLRSTPPERLAIVKSLLEDLDKERCTKQDLVEFLQQIERVYARSMPATKYTPADRAALEQLMTFKSYLSDRSSSAKLILEHFALCLPQGIIQL